MVFILERGYTVTPHMGLTKETMFQLTDEPSNMTIPKDGAITVTSKWARWRLKSPVSRLFTEPFIQAQIKENFKAPRHWTLWGECTGEFSAQRTTFA